MLIAMAQALQTFEALPGDYQYFPKTWLRAHFIPAGFGGIFVYFRENAV